MSRYRTAGCLVLGVLLAGCSARTPSKPLRVYVYAAPVEEEAEAARLHEALATVREAVDGRDRWFRLVDTGNGFDVGLRLIRYDIDRARPGLYAGAIETERIHAVEGVAIIAEQTERLTGFDTREVGFSHLQFAAGDLVEKLERYCRENEGLLARAR